MIKVYESNENKKLTEITEIKAQSWINLYHYDEKELNFVSEKTNINASLLKKMLDNHETSRIEVRNQATLIVLKLPFKTQNSYKTLPLGIVISDQYIMTICQHGKDFFAELLEEGVLIPTEKTNFTIQVFLKVASLYLLYLQQIQEELKRQEKWINQATNNDALKGLLQIEKSLVYFRNSLTSNELVLERILAGKILPLFESDNILMEDAIIENKQAIAMANLYQDLLASLTETYGTIISNNLNRVMKFLTGITIVFTIPTMVASFMGMNVHLGWFNQAKMAFPALLFISLLLSIFVTYIFKKKDWL